MKTEISRNSHQPKKRYSGVYQQQGRMLTDADWNELVEILKGRLNEALKDVVGNGSPLHRNVINNEADPPELQWGHLNIDGIVGEIRSADPYKIDFDYNLQNDFPSAPPLDGEYIYYADIWERTVTYLMETRLRDKGLHGADTCTRKQVMAQVKWCPYDSANPNNYPEQSVKNPPKGDAELTLTLRKTTIKPDPCDPCESQLDVESKVGNYLFRVEVHDVEGDADNPTIITLKWSRENGAEQFEVKGTKEEMPNGFISDKWVYEFFDKTSERHLGVHLADSEWKPARGLLTEIKESTESANSYATKAALPIPGSSETEKFVRRWDGYCTLDLSLMKLTEGVDKGVPLDTTNGIGDAGHLSIGGSLEIVLSSIDFDMELKDKTFVAGDYWLVDVREVEDKPDDLLMSKELPLGIEHHYLTLGKVIGGTLKPNPEADRKYAFPPLTELTRLFHVGGDGQEAMPNDFVPQSMKIGVTNGEWPVAGAIVEFSVAKGGGKLKSKLDEMLDKYETVTDEYGRAKCEWKLGPGVGDDRAKKQRVEVKLINPNSVPGDPESERYLDHPPIHFYANLSTAGRVDYTAVCSEGDGEETVYSLLSGESDITWPVEHGDHSHLTVKDVLDALLCKLAASHIPFDPGICGPEVSPTVKEGLGITEERTTIHDVLQKLLCELRAEIIPYDPNKSPGTTSRWRDIKELSGSGDLVEPNTVQKAIDDLIIWLESTDITYQVPECSSAAPPTLRSLLPELKDKNPGDLIKVDMVLDKLLCDLKATHLPLDKTVAGLCDDFDTADTVQDALQILCDRRSGGGGCAATVGIGGTYITIQEAFDKIKGDYVAICLLPGSHEITGDLVSLRRQSIKITGAGAYACNVILKGDIKFDAKQIILLDTGFSVVDDPEKSIIGRGQIILGKEICDRVDVQGCRFSRTFEGEKGETIPLVIVNAGHVRWQKNDSEANRKIFGYSDGVMPADIPVLVDTYKIFDKLWAWGPVESGIKYEEFESDIDSAAVSIKALSVEDRDVWVKSKPAEIIELPYDSRPRVRTLDTMISMDVTLDAAPTLDRIAFTAYTPPIMVSPRDSVDGVYEMLAKVESISVATIKDVLRRMLWASYEDDVALAVGGAPDYVDISYNTISGILSLQEDYPNIIPVPATGLEINISVEAYPQYITSESGVGVLHGNSISRIVTKIPAGTFVNNVIVKPLSGFDQLSLTDNVFGGPGNTLISTCLTLDGNRFEWSEHMEVVALAIAQSGTFTGNQGGYSVMKNNITLTTDIAIQRVVEERRQSSNKLIFRDVLFDVKSGQGGGYLERYLKWRNGDEIPAGTVMAFSANRPPDGWLECDGTQLESTEYPALFDAIGKEFGPGNESERSFNIPNLTDRFIRGWDGKTVGVRQGYTTAMPKRGFGTNNSGAHGHSNITVSGLFWGAPLTSLQYGSDYLSHAHAIIGGDPETRPTNVSFMYCIKY